MMAANYRHIGGHENRLGRHYSGFSAFLAATPLARQSLAAQKFPSGGSNRRSQASVREQWAHSRCKRRQPSAAAAREQARASTNAMAVPLRAPNRLKPTQPTGTESLRFRHQEGLYPGQRLSRYLNVNPSPIS